MLASRLPFEILTIIASFVSTADKLECIVVSRAWKTPFQDSLWRIIQIDRKSLETICDPSRRDVYERNGHRVRSIQLCGGMRITHQQIDSLQHCFTHPKQLNVLQARLDQESFGGMTDWSRWKSLTDLTMYAPCLTSDLLTVEMARVFPCLPFLTRLVLGVTEFFKGYHYTWETLEMLHASLPRLEYLDTGLPFAPVLTKDMARIKNVAPASCMTDLTLSGLNMSVGWLVYYSLKYPKLSEFTSYPECSGMIQPGDDFMDHWSLLTLPNILCLKSVNIVQHATVGKRQNMFWRLFQQFFEPVKHLKYMLYLTDLVSGQTQDVLDECIQLSLGTVETLEIFIRFPYRNRFSDSMKLGACSRLVDLKMELPETVVEFDTLLTNCPVLKNVQLDDVLVKLCQNTSKTPEPHCLESMSIEFSKVSSDTLGYISHRCRKLRSMSLRYVEIYGTVSQYTGTLLLDMSWTQFDRLRLNGMVYRDKKHILNILAIERVNATPQNVNQFRPNLPQPVNQRLWFHRCLEDDNDSLYDKVWMLGKKQAAIARDYYTAFASSIWNMNRLPEARHGSKLVGKRYWKKDLSKGYVTLRCGYVGQYSVESVIFDHNTHFL
ncbi:hypothetical protein CLU79DRAFT_752695 [Phycomyces nitens]|nr:hypothetical protein CLU79DRAFT_752695 [Phycomyces nitens]